MDFLDPHPSDGDALAFDEAANALLEQGELLSPSELHGCLCGLLGGGANAQQELVLAALEETLKISLHGVLADLVNNALAQVVECLESGDCDFNPLLPDDSVDLDERVDSLALWCKGFLSGFAQARVKERTQAEAVAPDSAEALRDFAAIAQAENEDGDESSESEYFELVEYTRVAAMNVLLDAGVSAPSSASRSGSGLSPDAEND